VQSWLAAFRGALAKLGWTEGSNLRIELRWAGYDPDRMKTFVKELVDLRPDAILSVTTPMTRALVRETQTIPIVIATVADPISSGFVTNLRALRALDGREMAGTAQANRAGRDASGAAVQPDNKRPDWSLRSLFIWSMASSIDVMRS
jgi:hypothetical protein